MKQPSRQPRATRRTSAQTTDKSDGLDMLEHNIERSRRATERRAAADPQPPATKSEAIYRALVALGDPSASSRQVADYVCTSWPKVANFVQHPNWNQFVTQTRNRAARALGVERRPISAGGRPAQEPGAASEVAVPHLLSLLRARSLLSDPGSLGEVVTLLMSVTPPQRLTQATSVLEELLKRHQEDGAALQRFLEDIQQLGIRPTT